MEPAAKADGAMEYSVEGLGRGADFTEVWVAELEDCEPCG
jgi:hypothetical protein